MTSAVATAFCCSGRTFNAASSARPARSVVAAARSVVASVRRVSAFCCAVGATVRRAPWCFRARFCCRRVNVSAGAPVCRAPLRLSLTPAHLLFSCPYTVCPRVLYCVPPLASRQLAIFTVSSARARNRKSLVYAQHSWQLLRFFAHLSPAFRRVVAAASLHPRGGYVHLANQRPDFVYCRLWRTPRAAVRAQAAYRAETEQVGS